MKSTAACRWHFALRDVSHRQKSHLSTPSQPGFPQCDHTPSVHTCFEIQFILFSCLIIVECSHFDPRFTVIYKGVNIVPLFFVYVGPAVPTDPLASTGTSVSATSTGACATITRGKIKSIN